MGENLIFDFMDGDKICSHVEVDYKNETVTCVDFVELPLLTVFGLNKPNLENLMDFFEERVFSKDRPDAEEMCELLGVKGFNPLEIVKKTHGRLWSDTQWIRFEGENLKYSDFDLKQQ